MTSIYLDGKELNFSDTDGDSKVRDLIGALEGELNAHRRLIAGFRGDGVSVEDWRVGEFAGKPISDFREIWIETSTADEIALKGTEVVRQYLAYLKDTAAAASDDIRRKGDCAAGISAICEGIKELMEIKEAVREFGGRYSINVFKAGSEANDAALLGHLESLLGAWKGGDTVLLADIIEYELVPLFCEMDKNLFYSDRL